MPGRAGSGRSRLEVATKMGAAADKRVMATTVSSVSSRPAVAVETGAAASGHFGAEVVGSVLPSQELPPRWGLRQVATWSQRRCSQHNQMVPDRVGLACPWRAVPANTGGKTSAQAPVGAEGSARPRRTVAAEAGAEAGSLVVAGRARSSR